MATATGIAAGNSTSAAAAKPLKISLWQPFAWLALAALVSPFGVIPEQFQTELAKLDDEWARFFRGLTLASVGIGSFALAMRQGLPGHLCFLSNGAATIAAATAMATARGETYAEVVKSGFDWILENFSTKALSVVGGSVTISFFASFDLSPVFLPLFPFALQVCGFVSRSGCWCTKSLEIYLPFLSSCLPKGPVAFACFSWDGSKVFGFYRCVSLHGGFGSCVFVALSTCLSTVICILILLLLASWCLSYT